MAPGALAGSTALRDRTSQRAISSPAHCDVPYLQCHRLLQNRIVRDVLTSPRVIVRPRRGSPNSDCDSRLVAAFCESCFSLTAGPKSVSPGL